MFSGAVRTRTSRPPSCIVSTARSRRRRYVSRSNSGMRRPWALTRMPAVWPYGDPLRTGGSALFEEAGQALGLVGMPQLGERLHLELPDPLPSDVESRSDFLQRAHLSVGEAEPHDEDLALPFTEPFQSERQLVLEAGEGGGIDRLFAVG